MKIYVPNISVNTLDVSSIPSEFNKKIYEYQIIYSDKGIYKFDGKNFYKQEIQDEEQIFMKINNIKIIIDHSKMMYIKERYQIHPTHKIVKYTETQYHIDKSPVKFIVVNDEVKIIDFYFLVNGEINDTSIKSDIYTFLSYIN